jgi:NAD+ synthase
MQTKINEIIDFIQQTVSEAGYKKVILGLSGGLDSAVVAYLSQQALGTKNVIAVMMPYKSKRDDGSTPESVRHALLVSDALQITNIEHPITDMVDSFFSGDPDANTLRRGNLMARIRMCVLYDLSAKHRALVVGTSNFSEIYTGYCTIHGDAACAFEPIGHLYKTEVFMMARLLGVPSEIVEKHPSADLWAGQTDETEMGITYATLDMILAMRFQDNKDKSCILSKGISEHDYELVMSKIKKSAFKRRMPLTLKEVW